MTQDPWDGILDDDEDILWQGQPTPGIGIGPGELATVGFGVLFSGFALFWMIMAASAGGFFWMFGLIHFSVGIGIILGATLWPAKRRKATWYTLTTKRAFIATITFFGRKTLKSYPITDATPIETEFGKLGAIYFADENYRTSKGQDRTRKIGFERLQDASEVARLMRNIQKDQQ